MTLQPGQRIELVSMPYDPAPIEPGARGTVKRVQDTSSMNRGRPTVQVEVDWDNGRTLALVMPPDEARVISSPQEPTRYTHRDDKGSS